MPELPLFPTTVAGSLPKPAWLAEPEKLWPKWQAEGTALTAAKEDAALLWLKTQEDAGIDIVTDGEQFRIHFVHGFREHLAGLDWAKKTQMGIRNNRYVVDVPTVTPHALTSSMNTLNAGSSNWMTSTPAASSSRASSLSTRAKAMAMSARRP